MITLEEALKKANERRTGIDTVFEYENGYMFSGSGDEGYIGGLNHSPVVVHKKTGEVMDMIPFINRGTGKEIGFRTL